MRDELIKDILEHLDHNGDLKAGNCSKDLEEKIEGLSIPLDVKRLLQWRWINKPARIGRYNLYSVEEIFNEEYEKFLNNKMLPIGYAANGDVLVMHFPEDEICEFGIISHDELYEEESEPMEAYVRVTQTIEELLYRTVEGMYLPIDYYSAIELSELKQEMKTNSKEST